jgi:hypothetical protein
MKTLGMQVSLSAHTHTHTHTQPEDYEDPWHAGMRAASYPTPLPCFASWVRVRVWVWVCVLRPQGLRRPSAALAEQRVKSV